MPTNNTRNDVTTEAMTIYYTSLQQET